MTGRCLQCFAVPALMPALCFVALIPVIKHLTNKQNFGSEPGARLWLPAGLRSLHPLLILLGIAGSVVSEGLISRRGLPANVVIGRNTSCKTSDKQAKF